MIGRAAVLALAMSLSGTAVAQEMDFTNPIAGDFAMLGIQHEVLNRSLGIDDRPGKGRAPARPRAFAAPARPGAPAASFRYQPSPALRQSVAQDFLARAARRDPRAARAIADEMARHDFGKAYADLVGPFGLRPDDAADALTAYVMLGWMIATGAPDPTAAQVAAVRAQIGQRAAANPAFTDPQARAKLGEQLKLQVVILKAGWQSAGREGTLRRFSDGIAAQFLQSGVPLRSLRLGNAGFAGF